MISLLQVLQTSLRLEKALCWCATVIGHVYYHIISGLIVLYVHQPIKTSPSVGAFQSSRSVALAKRIAALGTRMMWISNDRSLALGRYRAQPRSQGLFIKRERGCVARDSWWAQVWAHTWYLCLLLRSWCSVTTSFPGSLFFPSPGPGVSLSL